MLSAALLLFANSLLFSLRLDGGGSFPRPLKADEEAEYLRRLKQGDPEARSALIEHNLRLVAHVVKKYCTERQNPGAALRGAAQRAADSALSPLRRGTGVPRAGGRLPGASGAARAAAAAAGAPLPLPQQGAEGQHHARGHHRQQHIIRKIHRSPPI